MGCGTSMVKYLLLFFNFLFVIAGILLVTGGALSHVGYDKYMDLAREADLDSYKAPPILMMVIGSIIFVIAFLGCCGAMRENNCMMMTYALILGILLIAEITIAVLAHVYKDDFRKELGKGLKKSMMEYGYNDTPLNEGWDSMQQNLKCCGVDSYLDWAETTWNPNPLNRVPTSCCITPADGCSNGLIPINIYTQGCLAYVLDDIPINYIIYGAAGVAVVELLGIIFACCLAGRFRRKRYNNA